MPVFSVSANKRNVVPAFSDDPQKKVAFLFANGSSLFGVFLKRGRVLFVCEKREKQTDSPISETAPAIAGILPNGEVSLDYCTMESL